MLVRIANREDPDKTALGLHCLSRPFWQATGVRNFQTFIVSRLIWVFSGYSRQFVRLAYFEIIILSLILFINVNYFMTISDVYKYLIHFH